MHQRCLATLRLLAWISVLAAACSPAAAQDGVGAYSSGSGAAPLGTSNSYLWLRHSIGDGLGYRDSYSNVGAFVPLADNLDTNTLVYFEPRVLVTNSSQFGANAGLGFRTLMPEVDKLFGLSLWYDRDNGHFFNYDQLAASAELLGDVWGLRGNVYVPMSTRNRLISENSDFSADPSYLGRNILLGLIDRDREVALSGADLELGYNVQSLPGLRLNSGYYYYQGPEVGAAHGAKVRANYQMNDVSSVGVSLTDDRIFGTNAVFNVTLQWPRRNVPDPTAYYVEDRINMATERHDRVVATRERTQEQVFAQDRITRLNIDVVHVDDDAAAGGDGSVEQPVNSLSAAQSAAVRGSIIFVREGTYTDNIVLQNRQRLLGDGLAGPNAHMISSLQGDFLLPDQNGTGSTPLLASTNSSFSVLLGPGTFGTEVAGFTIQNGSASPVAGIVGVANDSFYIHNNSITTANGYGVVLVNSTSDGGWVNGSAPDAMTGIFNNQISDNAFGGIAVAHVTLTPADLIELGVDSETANQLPAESRGDLVVRIDNNQVTDNGTSAATGPLDDKVGAAFRYGLAVASSTSTQGEINATIVNNQITGNGLPGSSSTTNGGIIIGAGETGSLTATISNNQVNNNSGVGIAVEARDSGTVHDVAISSNSQINGNRRAGIAAAARGNGQVSDLVISQNASITNNGLAAIEESGGILLQAEDNSQLNASITGNAINANNSLGIGVTALDDGTISGVAISGNSINDNLFVGVAAEATGTALINNLAITSNTGINGNDTAGIALQASGAGQITNFAISNNSQINANGRDNDPATAVDAMGGILLGARDGGQITGDILNNGFAGNFGLNILAATLDDDASPDSSLLSLRINGNSLSHTEIATFINRDPDEPSLTFNIAAGVLLFTEEGTLTISQMANNNFIGNNVNSTFDSGLLFRNFAGTMNLNMQNNSIHNWRQGINGRLMNASIVNATISNNLFGTKVPGGIMNNLQDVTIESEDQSTINLTFNNNMGDGSFSFDELDSSTFNLSASGNDPAPSGP